MTNRVRKRHSNAASDRTNYTELTQLPNIGPACAADLRLLRIRVPADLLGRDPYKMYELLCKSTGRRHDPCVIDVFISVVRFMAGEPAQPWWHYTPQRKARLCQQSLPRRKRVRT